MKQTDLAALADITELAFQREQAKLQPILAEEGRIRRALAHLDEQVRRVRTDPESVALMRPCGADVAWQSWEGRTRRALNMQLAHVMAEKTELLHRVRSAFGKTCVVDHLRSAMITENARRKAREFEHRVSSPG
ncbi:hypothetical protein [Thalassococcus sp. S3]|uniref:hypothetical protein n=1 Tax=Thalassococcus sp. S3 TaxID=2017482 RepID=UPI0010243337|nr:hypothetical protein [Thalassococcus sp. S3]QBF29699.1 hypothetical protein CFI11_00520 [Thalassococcus sp. S3]